MFPAAAPHLPRSTPRVLLASRPLPPNARVRFVVVIRSPLVAEALDGFMLPDAHGNTGVPWLTTEVHLTRKATPPSTALAAGTLAASACPPPPGMAGPHAFRGGYRLATLAYAESEGVALLRAVRRERTSPRLQLYACPYCNSVLCIQGCNPIHPRLQPDASKAAALCIQVSAPYAVSHATKGGSPSAPSGYAAPRKSRSAAADEVASVAGAAAGFLALAWPLLWRLDDAVLDGKPTLISGLGGLALSWTGALLGALAALLLTDVARCYAPSTVALRSLRKVAAMASEGSTHPSEGSLSSDAPGNTGFSSSGEASDEGAPSATAPPHAGGGGLPPASSPAELLVRLASNGARPCMKSVLRLFTAECTAPSALAPLRAFAISEPTSEPTGAWPPSPFTPSGRQRRPSHTIELGSPCERAWAKLTVPSLPGTPALSSLGTAETAQPMLVAAGGPKALLDSLSNVLPQHLTLQRLTHPM